MARWDLYGTERRENFERYLKPEGLKDTLSGYRKVFGNAFGVTELLKLMDIEAKVMIAEAINDAPEFLLDQIGKASDSSEFPSTTYALYAISESLDNIAAAKENGGAV